MKVLSTALSLIGAIALAAGSASAATDLTLAGPVLPVYYQQTAASPCVIGGSNCLNGGFPYTNAGTGGAGTLMTEMSPVYTAAAISSIVPSLSNIIVGIDLNQTVNAQDVYFFKAWGCNGAACDPLTGTLIAQYNPDTGAVGNADNEFATLGVANNGVGWSDYTLSGLDLTGFERIQFQAKWFNNDGADRFFLIGCTPGTEGCGSDIPDVPEPSSMFLMGGSLLALAYWRKRKNS